MSCKWSGIHTCYFFKQMWNNTKYAILNIDNLNTKMSEIQSVWDEIKECKKTCNWRYMFFSWIERIFFRIDVVITMYIINPAQFWGHILIFFEKSALYAVQPCRFPTSFNIHWIPLHCDVTRRHIWKKFFHVKVNNICKHTLSDFKLNNHFEQKTTKKQWDC